MIGRASMVVMSALVASLALGQTPPGRDFVIDRGLDASALHARASAESSTVAFVAWQRQHEQAWAIRGGRYDTGMLRTPLFDIAVDTRGEPAIGCNGDGRCVVVWRDRSGCVSGRVFIEGIGAATFQDCDVGLAPAVAVSASGGWLLVGQRWSDHQDIFGRVYGADGMSAEVFRVNLDTANFQERPAVAATISGRFCVVWQSFAQTDDPDYGVRARWIEADGSGGEEIRINQTVDYDQRLPAVAPNVDGTVLISWTSCCEGGGFRIYTRPFDDSGAALRDESTASTRVVPYPPGYSMLSAISPSQSSAYLILWDEWNGRRHDIFIRRRLADSSLGPIGRVNARARRDHADPSAAVMGDRLLAVWTQTLPSLIRGRHLLRSAP